MNHTTTITGRTKFNVPMRAYFFDATTGEELYSAICTGNREAGIWNGKRYMDTRLGIDVVDFNTRLTGVICADAFPGRRVIVKIWTPMEDRTEWVALVDPAKGWVGNESEMCNTAQHTKLGSVAEMAKRVMATRRAR